MKLSTSEEYLLKEAEVGESFYPFTSETLSGEPEEWEQIHYPARIAVWDDPAVTPRVVVVEPKDVKDYLEEITREVTRLSHEQGGSIPFMIIREVVENFIHSYFTAPTISILDGGNTIRFADQGPGIQEKERALEYGTTSATEQMKRYIRGVGSGLPLAYQYMKDKGGTLTLEDNISTGLIVTISAAQGAGVVPEAAASVGESQAVPAASFPLPDSVSERGRMVLEYLREHDSVGPTDLCDAFGGSQPTWSRELKTLDAAGLVVKRGQKRLLTEYGRAYLGQTAYK